jgi:hypothetical protein
LYASDEPVIRSGFGAWNVSREKSCSWGPQRQGGSSGSVFPRFLHHGAHPDLPGVISIALVTEQGEEKPNRYLPPDTSNQEIRTAYDHEELAGGREEQAQQAASAEKPRHLFFKFCRFPETRGF